MKPAPFAYVRPSTLAEAVEALAADPDAKVLAGGQSLVPLLSMRLAAPSRLVDINGIEDLARIEVTPEGIRVGALARHAEVERHLDVRRVQPLVPAALRLVAHATIRNRGTTVGSLVHADAAAEMPAVLVLLDGTVTAASTRGERVVPAADLFVGPLESSLRSDEVATEALFPALAPGHGVACDEVARRHGDYALCGVAALVGTDAEGAITAARTSYWSVADVPTALDLTPALAGDAPTEQSLDAAVTLALSALEPEGDIHATADYRAHLARVLTRRVLAAAYDDARSRREEPAA